MPSNDLRQSLISAVLQLMIPIVRVLLRNGISYGEYAELAKRVYVDVARSDFVQPGQRQTASRISAITGLTRREIGLMRDLDVASDEESMQRHNRTVRVISGWVHDQRFRDAQGQPADLPLEGVDSFNDLVKSYSGDVPTVAMLSVLEEAGNIRNDDGQVRLLRRAYVPDGAPPEIVRILGQDAYELMTTIVHNIDAAPADKRFQRKVAYRDVSRETFRTFKVLAAQKSQSLLEEFDNWLANQPDAPSSEANERRRVTLGIYYFEEDPQDDRSDPGKENE
jgi:hypothetical protein